MAGFQGVRQKGGAGSKASPRTPSKAGTWFLAFLLLGLSSLVIAPTANAATFDSASVVPDNPHTGQTTAYEFTFNLPSTSSWPPGGQFKATFDANSGVTLPPATGPGAATVTPNSPASTTCLGTSLTYGATRAGTPPVLFLNRTTSGSLCTEEVKIKVSGIQNPSTRRTFSVQLETSGVGQAAPDNTVAPNHPQVTIISSMAVNGITADDPATGKTATYTFDFVPVNPWPANGKFAVTLPSGWSTTWTTTQPTVTLQGCGNPGSFSAPSAFILTRSGGDECPALSRLLLTVSGIKSQGLPGTPQTIAIRTQFNDGTTIEDGTGTVTLTSGTFASLSVAIASGSSTAPSSATSYAFTFTPSTVWPSNGRFTATFPSGFVISNLSVTTTGCTDGTFSATNPSGQLVVVVRTPDASPADCTAQAVITLSGITNPNASGSHSFDLGLVQIQANDGTVIERGSGSAIVETATAPLFTNSFASGTAGAATSYALVIRSDNAQLPFTWPANGQFKATFPPAFDLSNASPSLAVGSSGGCTAGGVTLTRNGQEITVLRDGTGTACSVTSSATANQLKTLTISGIKNPGFASTTAHSIAIKIQSNGGASDIATGVASATVNTAGALAAPTITPASAAAGATISYTFTFTTTNVWPSDGKFTITFPDISNNNYDLGGVGNSAFPSPTLAGCSGSPGALTATGSNTNGGRTVTVTRTPNSGGGDCAAGELSLTVHGIKNPGKPTAAPTFAKSKIKTLTSAGNEIDVAAPTSDPATVSSAAIVAGSLSVISIIPGDHTLGKTTPYTFKFDTAATWSGNGRFVVTFPSGYSFAGPIGVSAAAESSGCTFGTVSISGANPPTTGTTVTVLRGGAVPTNDCSGVFSITLTNINNPSVAGTQSFAAETIKIQTSTPENIASGTGTVNVGINTGTLSLTAVEPTVTSGGVATSYLFGFQLGSAWPGGGTMDLAFPSGYSITGTPSAQWSNGCSGSFTATVVSPTLLRLQRAASDPSCAAGAAITIKVDGIKNPAPGSYSFSPAGFKTQSGGADIDVGAGATVPVAITSGALAVSPIAPASTKVGATTTYPITFTPANPIPFNGKIVVAFPAGFDVSQATLPEGSVTGCFGTFTLSINNDAREVHASRPQSGGSQCGAGSPLTLTIQGVKNPGHVATFSPITVKTMTNGGASVIDSGSASVTLTPGALAVPAGFVSLAAGTNLTGKSTIYTLTFTTATDLPVGGTFVATLPSAITVPNGNLANSTAGPCSGFWVQGSGQVVTATKKATPCAAGSTVTLNLEGIQNPKVSGTQTFNAATFGTRTSDNKVIDQGPATTLSLAYAPNALTVNAVTATPSLVGRTSSVNLDFTVMNPWPADGRLRVAFPAGFDVSGVGATATAVSGSGCTSGSFSAASASASPPTVLVTRSGSAVGCTAGVKLALTNIKNIGVSGSYNVSLATQTSGGAGIDAGYTPVAQRLAITAGALSALSVTPGSAAAGATTAYTFGFTTSAAWPANGTLQLTFPADYDLSGPLTVPATGGCASGGFSVVRWPNTQTLNVTRDDTGASCPAGSLSVTVGGVKNPAVSGTKAFSGAFARTQSAGFDIDVAPGASSIPVSITGRPLLAASVQPEVAQVAKQASYAFTLTLLNPLPANGRFNATFPAGIDVSGLASQVGSSGCSGTFTAARGGQGGLNVTATRSGTPAPTECPAGSTLTLVFGGIKNPGYAGPQAIAFKTMTSGGADIDTASATVNIVPGTLSGLSATPNSAFAGATTFYTLGLTVETTWPANGRLLATFPAGYSLGAVAAAASGSCATGSFEASADAATRTVTVQRANGGAACASGGTLTLALDKVTNPGTIGPAGSIQLRTQDHAGADIDTGSAVVAPDIRAAPLGVSVSASPTTAGSDAAYAFSLSPTVAWPSAGRFLVTFPTGFDVAGANGATATLAGCTASPGGLTVTASGTDRKVVVTRSGNGPSCPAFSALTLTLPGIKNPTVAGSHSIAAATMKLQDSSQVDLAVAEGPATVAITSGPAAHITAHGGASFPGVVAGAPQALHVKVSDQHGNLVAGTAVAWAITQGSGGSLSTASSETGADGVASTAFTGAAVGSYVVQAASGSLSGGPVSFAIGIVPGPAASLAAVGGSSFSNVPAGADQTLLVRVTDQAGNPVPGASVSWVASGGGTLVPTLGNTGSDGVASTVLTTSGTAASHTATATVDGLPPLTFTVNTVAGAAAQLSFATQPGGAASTVALSPQPVVRLLDANGNLVSTDSTHTVTLALTTPGSATLAGTRTATLVGGVATFSGLSVDKAGTYTLTATTDAGSFTQASSSFQVTVGAAASLRFTVQPGGAASGLPLSPQPRVTLQDAGGNLVSTDSTHTVTLALTTPGSATLAGTRTATLVGGVATFSGLSVDKAGTYTLTASTDTPSVPAFPSASFVVAHGAASQLAFATQPGGAASTVALSPQPVVRLLDANGNLVSTDSTHTVTLALTTPGSATLAGTRTATLVGGVATFSGLSVDKAGTHTLVASTNLGSFQATSASFTVTVGTPARMAFLAQPGNAMAGSPLSQQPVVQLQDKGGNPVLAADGQTVTLALSFPNGATLTGTPTGTLVDGVAAFTDLAISKPGTYTLWASTPVGAFTQVSQPFTISGSGSRLVFATQPGGSLGGGLLSVQPVVHLVDAGGNLVSTDSTHTVTLTLSGRATLSGTRTVTLDHGVAAFGDLAVDKAGSYTLLASTDAGSFKKPSAPFKVAVGPAAQLAFQVQPGGAFTDKALSPQPIVALVDAGGNVVATDSTHTVTLALADPQGATLSGTQTVTLTRGKAAFPGLKVDQAGSYSLAASTDAGSFTVTSQPFSVSGPAARLVFATEPGDAQSGKPLSPQPALRLEDAEGNLVSTESSRTVTLALTDPQGATLAGGKTVRFTKGIATFTNLAIKMAGTYTLTAKTTAGAFVAESSPLAITPGPAASLAFATQPVGAAAGAPLSQQPIVVLKDANGNVVTTNSVDTVTLTLTSPRGAVLSGPVTLTVAGGVAAFDGLSVDKPGAYTLTARTSAGTFSRASASFQVA